jgi:hypothetical protein
VADGNGRYAAAGAVIGGPLGNGGSTTDIETLPNSTFNVERRHILADVYAPDIDDVLGLLETFLEGWIIEHAVAACLRLGCRPVSVWAAKVEIELQRGHTVSTHVASNAAGWLSRRLARISCRSDKAWKSNDSGAEKAGIITAG